MLADHSTQSPDPANLDSTSIAAGWQGWLGPLLVGLLVLSFALVGILSRPLNFSSALWPVNPVLAGVLVRHPHLFRSPWAWCSAIAGFLAADLLTGSNLLTTLWFTAANLVGISCCGWLLLRADAVQRSMQGPYSSLLLFQAALISAVASCVVGAPASIVLFGAEAWPSIAMWVSGELMNFTLILPVILGFPRHAPWRWQQWVTPEKNTPGWLHSIPVLCVAASLLAAHTIGGPGTLSFVVPGLLWCALSYSFLSTSVLCLIVCLLLNWIVAGGQFQFTPEYWPSALSLRVGITLLALGPLAVASNRIARKHAIDKLDYVVNHDFLTGLLSRKAFFQQAVMRLQARKASTHSAAVMALDLDHFKRINDQYGHSVGDEVLRQFSAVARSHLRGQDLLGRLGGEEFAALLPHTDAQQAQHIAAHIVQAVSHHPFTAAGHASPIHVTVSIGLVHCAALPPSAALDGLLQQADVALYQAKVAGRNRFVAAPYVPVDAAMELPSGATVPTRASHHASNAL